MCSIINLTCRLSIGDSVVYSVYYVIHALLVENTLYWTFVPSIRFIYETKMSRNITQVCERIQFMRHCIFMIGIDEWHRKARK